MILEEIAKEFGGYSFDRLGGGGGVNGTRRKKGDLGFWVFGLRSIGTRCERLA